MATKASERTNTTLRLPDDLVKAAHAAFDKKATDVVALDLRKAAAFTDYFLICTGQNTRQVRAIAEAMEMALRKSGVKPAHVEGYERSDWVLLDCFDFVVHVFTEDLRHFYSLEKLWGSAERTVITDPAA